MATDTLVKVTELTELTPAVTTDVLPIVSDPGGSPVTKKITVKELLETPVLYSIVPAGDFALGVGTSVQSAFPTTGDVFTVEAATTYQFEGQYFINKSGTTCTTGMAFALGGSATITSMKYIAQAQNVAANTTGATVASTWVNQVAATVVNATATSAVAINFKGIIRMNAGGTITPQIIFSAAPTSPVMVADSFIKFTKIGTNVENTVGSVS